MEQPWYVVVALAAIPMLLFGLYFISPWYPLAVIDPSASLFAQVVGTVKEQFLFGAFYIAVPAISLWGVARNKLRWVRVGAFGLFLTYTFASLVRLVALGPLAVIWLFLLSLGLIAGVARLVLR